MAVCFCASTLFLLQTYWTLSDYFKYRTIIEMQLKFEAAPFPAATVCNLNAFKYSELIQYDEIKEGVRSKFTAQSLVKISFPANLL
ncbi:unnamed protein product [Heligmosomoides polygyrus]|uniref:Acid-sensing ion channel 1 n=1 Tax=Heligmosomoides polygyrus TaxID=6339 RepID=A0A183FBU8_HELPZ|nr:unnamed protein product [Heligmosomoides polygyrus]